MIIVKVDGSEKLRFEPHQVGEDFVITPRRGRPWPIPIGAHVYDGDEFLGVVIHMRRVQFQRCHVVFEPPVAIAPGFLPTADEGVSWEFDEAIVLPEWPTTPGEAGLLPLEALALSDRILTVLIHHGISTCEALQTRFDEGKLLELSGIGPGSLAEITSALAQEKANGTS